MTANKNFKRIIRRRMFRTGESYSAARRHFLDKKGLQMTKPAYNNESRLEELPIGQLQLTLETTRILKAQGIERVRDLLAARSDGKTWSGMDAQKMIEIRDVLASRGR